MQIIHLDEMEIEIIRKNRKNLYLRVYPLEGRVKASVPQVMNMKTVDYFLVL